MAQDNGNNILPLALLLQLQKGWCRRQVWHVALILQGRTPFYHPLEIYTIHFHLLQPPIPSLCRARKHVVHHRCPGLPDQPECLLRRRRKDRLPQRHLGRDQRHPRPHHGRQRNKRFAPLRRRHGRKLHRHARRAQLQAVGRHRHQAGPCLADWRCHHPAVLRVGMGRLASAGPRRCSLEDAFFL